jgi:GAF domain-containing protein
VNIHEDGWAVKLEHLHSATIAVASAHDVDEALQVIAEVGRKIVGAQMTAIGVPGEPGQPMAHFVVAGMSDEERAQAGRPPMGRGVLGVILNSGQPLNVPDIREHEEYLGLPNGHPSLTSFLGVPIRTGGEVIGDLYFANKITADSFTDEDQHIAEMLAAHAAVVINNLRYQEKRQEVAVIQEHARLAPMINDDVLQTLYGAGLLLNGLDYDDQEKARQQVSEVQARLDIAIKNLREHLLGLAGNGAKYP